MNKSKKILSWILLSSLILWNFSFSYASSDISTFPTTEEKTKVEAEVLKLQSNIYNNSKTYLEKLTSDFQKLTNYEESWNSKIEFMMNQDMFWSWNFNMSLDNYKVKNATLDSEVSADTKVNAKYSPVYWTWFELDLSSFASMISKDGEVYALLKDLDFKVTDENMQKVLEELKKQYSDNKYIKFPSDENSKMMFEYIKNFSLGNFYSQAETVLSVPLLTTYKKDWNKYLLVPTKYACDTYFELDKKFNSSNYWYEPRDCSESIYKSFIKEFVKTWELYLTLGDENTLWYYAIKDDTTIDFSLNYDEKNISKVDLIVTPDQTKYKNEWFNFHFASKEYLKYILNVDNWKTFINFDSELDENNNFKEVSSNVVSDVIKWALSLKNNKITWFYTVKQKWYDYTSDNWDYVLKNVYWVKITWTTSSTNELKNLDIKFAWVDIKSKNVFLKWKTSYSNWDFSIKLSSNSEYSSFDFSWKWYITSRYFKLNSSFTATQKTYDYYADTQDRDKKYTWRLDMVLNTQENKDDLDFNLVVNEWNKDILKLYMFNKWQRIYKDDVIIEAPNDAKDFDMSEFENMNY